MRGENRSAVLRKYVLFLCDLDGNIGDFDLARLRVQAVASAARARAFLD